MKLKYLLQLGLALTFLYAGINSLMHPSDWIGFVPAWLGNFGIASSTFLFTHSIFEIVLSVWLLSNKKIRIAGLILALDLLAIILVNGFSQSVFPITFRDIGLFFTALYLFLDKA
jgi:uncharacterized membrane protein YphA (DoxX/SURF4 family)